MTQSVEPKDLETVVQAAIEAHGATPDAFIPILLHINQAYGFIPASALRMVRRRLNQPEKQSLVSEGQLYGLVSFYDMLNSQAVGRHVVQFCQSAPCHVQGGREVLKSLHATLNLQDGETDPQNRFTLKLVNCLGMCGVGPVLIVDGDMYGNVRPEQLPDIFAKYA